jgi:hypothetical protein
MEKNLSLTIPRPCGEKWENFTPTSTGGFCSSCNKVVIDFTSMSDEEIFDFFNKKPVYACGRFRPGQLKAYSNRPPLKINSGLTLLKAGFLSLLFVLVNRQASAQTAIPKAKTEIVDQSLRKKKNDEEKPLRLVKGIVRSADDNMPIPGVNVYLKGSTEETNTDANGQFEFPRKLKAGDVLVFHFIGLETKEYIVPKEGIASIAVNMVCHWIALTGEVAAEEVYTTNPSGLRRWWWKIKALF